MPQQSRSSAELWREAEWHASRRDWPRARECFQRVLADTPGDTGALVQLSYIESLAGHYRAAREFALRACGTELRDPAVVAELAARLRTFNAAPQLDRCVERLKPLARIPVPLLLACAAQYSYLNQQERALELLDEARRADPDYPPTLLARAQVLIYLGRFDQAETDIRRSLARAPEIAQGWWLLARVRRQHPDSHHVDAIRRQLQRPGRKPLEVAVLANALHKELDDLGEHDAAWAALEQSCRAKRSTLDYRAADTRALVDALISMPGPTRPEPAVAGGAGARVPIFIVGMHRSGTTLLEQLLDGHPQVRGVGELYDFTSQMRLATDHHCRGVVDATIVQRAAAVDFGAIGAGYLHGMQWRLGEERFFTDKLPSNFLNIGFICRALPQARILHMSRDPMETCFSSLRELFSDACAFSYDQAELADYYHQYQRLMAHWQRMWPGRILDVDYSRLTRHPEEVLQEVSRFCGFGYDPGMLQLGRRTRGVATASSVQVRAGIQCLRVPKWMPYRRQLAPLIEGLGELAGPHRTGRGEPLPM